MAGPQAAARIFISYRREDSSGHVLALLPALRREFGDRIFKDTDNIPPGEDFVKFIKNELQTCSVMLAIIGKDWLTAQDPRLKTRRLDSPDDFLRVELSTALRSDRIRVIPVLIERATMPASMDLPADIAGLAQRNALELSDVRWDSDVQLLIQAIQRAGAASTPPEAPAEWPELQDVQKRRAREIAGHLSNARQAFVARGYEATLLACEKVLLLDPQNVEALDLLDLARTTTEEQQIETWLTQARQALDQGDIGTASDLIDQALAVDPQLEAALALRKRMLALRRERERGRERARVVAGAVERARTKLNEQNFESAVRHADDALTLEPQSTDAQEIRSRASASVDQRRRHREPGAASSAQAPGLNSPGFWSSRRIAGLAAAAAVILAAATGLWVYRQQSQSTRSPQSAPPTAAPAGPPQAAVTEPAPAPPPVSSVPVEKPPAAVPPNAPTDADRREEKLAQLRRDARDQFQRGQRRALNTVADGLEIAPQDSELQSILDSILTDAQRITGRAKEAAVIAGAPQYAKAVHQEALKLERDASQQITGGRKDTAIRTLWRAEEAFDRAERDARLERAQLGQLQDDQAKQRLARGNDKPANQPGVTGKSNDAPAPAAGLSGGKPSATAQPRGPETPPAPPSSPTATDLEKARVSGIVQRYAMGYSALNAAAVYAVYPAEAVWQFPEFDSYTLSLADCAIEISSDGASATAVCTATHNFKRKRAAAVSDRVGQTFTLRRRGAGWIIVSIAYDRAPR
jgi:tetratricopeptide (TPR) repeat protein